MIDTWALREERLLSEQLAWKESIFTIANGYLSTRGSFEEKYPGQIRATFINGLFVSPPGELPLLAAVPDWTHLRLTVNGTPFQLASFLPAGYQRVLDLRSGLLTRSVLWRGPETGVVRLRFRRLVSMTQPGLAALELTLTSLTETVTIAIESGIDATIPSPKAPAWLPGRITGKGPGHLQGEYTSIDDRQQLHVDCVVRGLADSRLITDASRPRVAGQLDLKAGETASFTKYVTYRAERDRSIATTLPGEEVSFSEIAEESARAWERRWKSSTCEIGGDPEAELAGHFAAFHLIGAASPNDPGAAIGAKLMSGFGYRHHVFWDTDIFVAPYFNVAQPDLGRCHLAYRYRGLDGARRKAKHYGRSGAFFAWESADTGDEVTPEWATPHDGPPVRIWTGELEEHITSDIAWVADHYWRWTGDDRFLADEGAEIIIDGARYWASRLEHEPDGAHIRDVIGPDEYHIHVDDSFFTNLMAAWQLRRAGSVISWLRDFHPEKLDQLSTQMGISDLSPSEFNSLADRIVLHRREDGVWEQHQGFFGLEPVDLAAFSPRQKSMHALLGEERLQRLSVIKQADVVMALALLPGHTGDRAAHRANWHYYQPRADHGSSLSLGFHALVAAQMGEVELAYRLFRSAAAIDLEDSMGNGRDGLHGASLGGILQTLIFGFGGLTLAEGEPVAKSNMPGHWSSLGFSFFHHGELKEVELIR